jgi:hypothetical protein
VRRPLTDNVILLVYLLTCCGEYQQAQCRVVAGLPTSKRFARIAISLVHVFVRGGISNISMEVLPVSELLAKRQSRWCRYARIEASTALVSAISRVTDERAFS